MNLSFVIDFIIKENEELCIVGNLPILGQWDESKALVLRAEEDGACKVVVECEQEQYVSYRYFLQKNKETVRRESGEKRELLLNDSLENVIVKDFWREDFRDNELFETSFFSTIAGKTIPYRYEEGNIQIRVVAPFLSENEILCIVGNCEELGYWNPDKALPLNVNSFSHRSISLSSKSRVLEYKYLIKNDISDSVIWEEGNNRTVSIESEKQGYVLNDEVLRFGKRQWKGAGVSIPVFSLRTKYGFGVGEFPDIKKLGDWSRLTGMKVIQILPINDTIAQGNRLDSYPYNPISTTALHPMYLHLPDVAGADWDEEKEYYWEQEKINLLSVVDYEKVVERKLYYLRKVYDKEYRKLKNDREFQIFINENETWLAPYVTFCYLRDKYGTANFREWGTHQLFDSEYVKSFINSDNIKENLFYCFLQYHLDKQLTEAVNYIRKLGIALKGDIPIGIGRYSVEAWQYPDLFNAEVSAGAPPDTFSIKGQNWGFPTYNWERMAKDNYQWWKNRLGYMSKYFDAYRLDHILGFFRIWSIPTTAIWGVLGYFDKAMPYTELEIQKAGVLLNIHIYTNPCLTEKCLQEVCGNDAAKIKQQYLKKINNKYYHLKDTLNTQEKIKFYFEIKQPEPTDSVFYEYLLLLATEVLFIEDKEYNRRYHPRVFLQNTYVFNSLSLKEQEALKKLHDSFFYNRHNEMWKNEATEKLKPLVYATKMLACGEDLGMLVDAVESVMQDSMILSLEIERMPKRYGESYTDLSKLPYTSVCTTSTHDMAPLRLWWKEMSNKDKMFYIESVLSEDISKEKPNEEIYLEILKKHLQSSSILTIFPLQDWLSIDKSLQNPFPESERINIPDNPDHYWQYRMHLRLESLLNSVVFNKSLQKIIQENRR